MKKILLNSVLIFLGGVFLRPDPLRAAEPEYQPIKVPLWPGLRQFVEGIELRQLKPYLGEAGGDILFASDLSSEVGRGGTNAAAALGNGGLSVEISPWADLTVFRWPSPLYSDQLRYWTLAGTKDRPVRMVEDAPSADWKRYGHPQEPCPSIGSKGGLVLDSGDLVWLGDPSWSSSRAFVPLDSMNLVTTLARPELTAEVTDFVDPDQDLLVRSFRIIGPARTFIYHSTFAPQVPDPKNAKDWTPKGAGFAAVYLSGDRVIVHFQPKLKPGQIARPPKKVPASAADLDAQYPEGGSFVAWGFEGNSRGFQIGADRCMNTVATKAPAGGYEDAQDGELSGNEFFTGLVDAALAADLSGRENTITVYIAAADSAQKAVELIRAARAQGYENLRANSAAHWQAMSAKVHLPQDADPVMKRVFLRSVLNVLIGQDRESGAIVASISRQPPYHYEYPRDSAFFDLLLDLAGFPEAVTKHHQMLARTQYTQRLGYSPVWVVNYRSPFFDPSGNWPQKLTVDGSSPTSFLANPCEIDETALSVWNFWRHERSLPASERSRYVSDLREAFIRSADNLLKWIVLEKGWTRPAIEDDSFPPDATLHGASSTLAAMAAACDAGTRWNIPADKTEKYCAAARSLKKGIQGRSVYPEVVDHAGFRGVPWTLWPAPAFDTFEEPGAKMLKAKLAGMVERNAGRESPGFAYLGEEIVSLAMADQKNPQYRELLLNALVKLTHEVPFPGTDCFGEVTLWGDFAGTGQKVAQQRTAIPHIWNGAAAYLAGIAVYEPELLDRMQPKAP